uniref:Uncharacterized protein n=1 Tax=Globodera rostochiensis TaxID=31243 RepID=A0A914HLF4_GLORO
MKMFAMLMLRCVLIMHLFSFIQNGTLATLEELAALEKLETSCLILVGGILIAQEPMTLDDLSNIPEIKQKLNDLLDKVKDFPLKKETEELLKRRLEKPLQIAIGNCEKLEEEHKKVKNSELEDNKNYLENLLSKIRSFEAGYAKEMNTFLFEVGLELIKQVKWTSDDMIVLELKNKFMYLWELLRDDESYCDNNSSGWLWGQAEKEIPPQNQKEFVENIENFIVHTKLSILENELSAKIAGFEQQPLIDGDGFIEFSHNFKREWNKIKQKSAQLKSFDHKIALVIKEKCSKKLDELAKNALNETAQLKGIIIQNLDELVTKCHNDGLNAMKQIISEIGMFDCAAYKLLVRFEHEELDNTDFCAELEKAVEQDNKMVSTAYQVKDKITPTMK